MLKERARLLNSSIFLLDLTLVGVAFVAAHWLRSAYLTSVAGGAFPSPLHPLSEYLPLLPLALLTWGALLHLSGVYRSHRTVPLRAESWNLLRVCGSGVVIFALALYALRLDERILEHDRVSRTWLLLFAGLACLLLMGEKLALRLLSRYVRSRGFNYRTLLIVGTGPSAQAISRAIEEHDYWGFRIAGFVEVNGGAERAPGRYPVLGGPEEIPRLLHDYVVDDVIFAVGRKELGQMENLLLALEEQGIRTMLALNFFPHTLAKMQLSEIDGIPLLTFATAPTNFVLLAAKRGIDLLLSTLLLLMALPLVVTVAVGIKLSSGGNVLFRQTRCGLNGRRFTLYKFRTMVEDAEWRLQDLLHLNEMDGPVFKVANDPRVTRMGRLLRKFSLDELPQLWNVLRGDMSLVGPRPPIPEEVAQYERWQRRRLSMKPGLTCLWQVNGRNAVDFESWMALDLEYIDSWSLLLDLKILAKTIPVVLSGRGAS
jgi:exopolysaccharide biosynthesis polyprenyl glycosylphosphotransferase